MHLYLHLYLYLPPPSPEHYRRHHHPQLLQLQFCSVIPGTRSLNNPLSPRAEKCHPEKAAQPSGGCTSTSRLSSTLPWRCTKPHRGKRKHSSQAEKRRENSLPISRSVGDCGYGCGCSDCRYGRHHHKYYSYHFPRSPKAQEVSAIPSPQRLRSATQKKLPNPQSHVYVLALHQSEARRPASSSGRLCPAGWPGTSLALPCGVASYFRSYSFCLAMRCGVARRLASYSFCLALPSGVALYIT